MSAAESSLFELLEKANAHPGAVSVSALQEACVRVPYLSSRLTGRTRHQLYRGLFFDKAQVHGPDDFTPHAPRASDEQKAVAAQLREVFSDETLTEDQLQGFVCHFAAATGCNFDDDLTVVALTLATMVAAAELPPGKEKLFLLHQYLTAFRREFVVSKMSCTYESSLVPLLRLLLQYHDPLLSLHLDQRLVNIGSFLLRWVRRLFVVNGDFAAALRVWDWILIVGDPTLSVYFAVVFLIAHRERFLALQKPEEIMEALEAMTFIVPDRKEDAVNHNLCDGRPVAFVSLSSGRTLAQNADIAFQNTPRATQRVLDFFLFPNDGKINKSPEALAGYYASHAALPLERSDIVDSFSANPSPSGQWVEAPPLNYIVLDCRSTDSFAFARLPTAVHIGNDIGFDTDSFNRVVEKVRGVCGTHMCIFGTGRSISEEVNLLKMIALRFARAGFPYVSTAPGGFRAIAPLVRDGRVAVARDGTGPGTSGQMSFKESFSDIRQRFDNNEAVRRAREQLSAATSWGMGFMRRVTDKIQAANANTRAWNTFSAQRTSAEPTPLTQQEQQAQAQAQVPVHDAAQNERPQVFSLGGDDSDDEADEDFDLITSVPVYSGHVIAPSDGEDLPKGTVLKGHEEEKKPDATTKTFTGTAETAKTETGTTDDGRAQGGEADKSALEDIAMEIDDELNELFGDVAAEAVGERQSDTSLHAETAANLKGSMNISDIFEES